MQMRASKKPWRPADLLRVDEVLLLHRVLGDESEPLGDRLMCGHCLHLLYSRSRWSDLCQVSNVFIDEDCKSFELSTRAHKGARSAEMKARLLPIVCPCKGINDQNWACLYMELRERVGLELPLDGYGPMLPAPANDFATSWYKRALTSEEGADFMRAIPKAPKTAERRISTHSFKSILISWTAKYGLPDTSRAVLARHLSCATATQLSTAVTFCHQCCVSWTTSFKRCAVLFSSQNGRGMEGSPVPSCLQFQEHPSEFLQLLAHLVWFNLRPKKRQSSCRRRSRS